jgi:hypothetical protein
MKDLETCPFVTLRSYRTDDEGKLFLVRVNHDFVCWEFDCETCSRKEEVTPK